MLSGKKYINLIGRGEIERVIQKNFGVFNDMFKEFLKRDYIYPVSSRKTETIEFMGKHDVFFAKPNDGQCGKNIEKIDVIFFIFECKKKICHSSDVLKINYLCKYNTFILYDFQV